MCYSNVSLLNVNLAACGTKAIGNIPCTVEMHWNVPGYCVFLDVTLWKLGPTVTFLSSVQARIIYLLRSYLFISQTPEKMYQQDFAVLLPPRTRTQSQHAEYVNSISHCLLDAFLCVCACPHWLWSMERVLCGPPKRPWTLTVKGASLHSAGKACTNGLVQSGRRATNTWRAVDCAQSLLSNSSTSMEHCFSVVLMSVEGWLFCVQCWARIWHRQS